MHHATLVALLSFLLLSRLVRYWIWLLTPNTVVVHTWYAWYHTVAFN